jgi:seryl-tRNA synthetase
MLARERLRHETDGILRALAARGDDGATLRRFLSLDEERRRDLQQVEELKRQRNEASKRIGQSKAKGEDASDEIAAVSRLKADIERLEARLSEVDAELESAELLLPNVPHDSVPVGADAGANRVERVVGEPRGYDFEPKAHWDLGPALGILDFERGAKLSGSRFTCYFGLGARLERALAQLMLDLHTKRHGYLEVWPPLLVSRHSMVASGQLPKFEGDSFHLESADLYLVPTAEVPLCNLHRDEVLPEAALPLRYVAWTPCFRAEAGSHGRDVRGLIRQHQFHKVELVQYAHPEKSYEALAELTGHAERVLQALELPYRVVTLSTGDMGFASAKTHDLEAWLPGQDAYREISSCSNCEDFQARRANLRFRPSAGGKPQFVHTLNGSGLAVGRTLIAVLENYQQADGTVVVPEALRPYLDGLERIEPRAPIEGTST